ncbi:hypothetical protein EON65_20165, partial [archaeon]
MDALNCINTYVQSSDKVVEAQCITQISALLNSPQSILTLPDILVNMEPFLNSVQMAERGKVTFLLHEVVLRCILLSPAEVHLFVVFFCQRLSDFPSLHPSLLALDSLFKKHALSLLNTYSDFIDTYTNIQTQLNVPSYDQPIRLAAFTLLSTLIEHGQSEIRSSRRLVVETLLTSMEGERNPRILLLAFKSLSLFVQQCGASMESTLVKEIHDALILYFPISFASNTLDSQTVTGDMLSDSLFCALCPTYEAAQRILPFFIEQISSGDTIASRKDALRYVTMAVEKHTHTLFTSSRTQTHTQAHTHDHNHTHDHPHDHTHQHEGDHDNSAVSLHQLARLVYELVSREGAKEVVDMVMGMVGAVSFSIVTSMAHTHTPPSLLSLSGDDAHTITQTPSHTCPSHTHAHTPPPHTPSYTHSQTPSAWDEFQGYILSSTLQDIHTKADGVRCRGAYKLCVCLGSTGGVMAAWYVYIHLAPTLIDMAESVYGTYTKLCMYLFDYVYKGIHT